MSILNHKSHVNLIAMALIGHCKKTNLTLDDIALVEGLLEALDHGETDYLEYYYCLMAGSFATSNSQSSHEAVIMNMSWSARGEMTLSSVSSAPWYWSRSVTPRKRRTRK